MTRRCKPPPDTPTRSLTDLDPRAIDALYGLEPAFEPGAGPGETSLQLEPLTVRCPYCGEDFDTQADCSAGSSDYVEDCQVCCQPIEISLEVDAVGGLTGVRFTRLD
jgi:hypothetical protein